MWIVASLFHNTRSKDQKKAHTLANRPTSQKKLGQKRMIVDWWIKTPGVNRNVSPSSTCDPIDQKAS